MKLTITSEANNKLNELEESKDSYLLLHYDTEGRGCGVSGLPTIRFVTTKGERCKAVENDEFTVIIRGQQATFFEEEMKLDFVKNAFRLSSPQGMLNPIISQADLIKGDVA